MFWGVCFGMAFWDLPLHVYFGKYSPGVPSACSLNPTTKLRKRHINANLLTLPSQRHISWRIRFSFSRIYFQKGRKISSKIGLPSGEGKQDDDDDMALKGKSSFSLRVEKSQSFDWSRGKSIKACKDPFFSVLIHHPSILGHLPKSESQ